MTTSARTYTTPKDSIGAGSCYIEFGANRIGRVDVDFLSGPKPFGTFHGVSEALRVDNKEHFGASRRARWFGA